MEVTPIIFSAAMLDSGVFRDGEGTGAMYVVHGRLFGANPAPEKAGGLCHP